MKFKVYFSLSQLVFSGFHFGSSSSRWWSHSSIFLSFSRKGFYFFDLQYTSFCFRRALFFIEGLTRYRSSVLFIFGSHSFKSFRSRVNYLGCYWHLGKTTPGLISNYNGVLKRQIPHIRSFPSAVVVLDPMSSLYVFRECSILGIPILSICDSSMDPNYVTYPIPGNSSSYDASKLLLLLCLEAVLRGSRSRLALHYYRRRRRMYSRFFVGKSSRYNNSGNIRNWRRRPLERYFSSSRIRT